MRPISILDSINRQDYRRSKTNINLLMIEILNCRCICSAAWALNSHADINASVAFLLEGMKNAWQFNVSACQLHLKSPCRSIRKVIGVPTLPRISEEASCIQSWVGLPSVKPDPPLMPALSGEF